MTFATARVAPEKAVFRPALPLCYSPGMTEMQMATMTYREQLLHPNWQRKRLEIMQRDDFACRCCYDKETTLHVHHKQYVKGRLAWEYPDDELVTLCEGCHSVMHEEIDILRGVISKLRVDGPRSISQAAPFLAGWASDLTPEFASLFDSSPHTYLIGDIASHLEDHLQMDVCMELIHALKTVPSWVIRSVLTDAAKEMLERKDDPPPPFTGPDFRGEI